MLVKIPDQDWVELRDIFVNNWPEHILGYSIVNNFIELREKTTEDHRRNLKFYSLDGDWRSDGTFLVIVRIYFLLRGLSFCCAYNLKSIPTFNSPSFHRIAISSSSTVW